MHSGNVPSWSSRPPLRRADHSLSPNNSEGRKKSFGFNWALVSAVLFGFFFGFRARPQASFSSSSSVAWLWRLNHPGLFLGVQEVQGLHFIGCQDFPTGFTLSGGNHSALLVSAFGFGAWSSASSLPTQTSHILPVAGVGYHVEYCAIHSTSSRCLEV